MTGNTDANCETNSALRDVIEEVLDTVATFDGRLGFRRNDDGSYTLVFAGPMHRACAVIMSHIIDDRQTLNIQVKSSNGQADISTTQIYHGALDTRSIRYSLGQCLAAWYGDVVRFIQ